MLKFTEMICTTVLLTMIVCSGAAHAGNNALLGEYSGGGYKVKSGDSGSYIFYDRQGKKLVIPGSRLIAHGQAAEWTSKGYVYRLTGIAGSGQTGTIENGENSAIYYKVMLTVVNPQGQEVLNQMLNKIN
jgi:hypothetical protein